MEKIKGFMGCKGMRGINKDHALIFLKGVRDCLKGMKWSLNCGTLLGAIREGDFITWDKDIDLLLSDEHKDQLPQLVKCLNEKGLRANLVTAWAMHFIQIQYRSCPGHIGCPHGINLFTKFFKEKMRMVKVRGEEFPVPKNAEQLLTDRYGDWKIPLSNRDWAKLWEKRKEDFINEK